MPYYQKSQQNTSMKRNILFFTLLFKCALLSAQEEITAKITIDENSNLQVTQVFNEKHGFINNLSILDLLFNEGRYAVDYLKNQKL